MKLGRVWVCAAAGAAFFGQAAACDVGALQSLRPSSVEAVTVQFERRKPEMPLESANQIAALVSFIKRLGGDWAPGGGAGDGVIRFYKSGGVAASVFIAMDQLATDSCRRRLSREESEELFMILTAAD